MVRQTKINGNVKLMTVLVELEVRLNEVNPNISKPLRTFENHNELKRLTTFLVKLISRQFASLDWIIANFIFDKSNVAQ